MNRQTARASHALRQVGRDTASADTRNSAAFAGDQAQYERYLNRRKDAKVTNARLKRSAPGQRRGVTHIRPSDAPQA